MLIFFIIRVAGEATVSGEDRLNEVQIYLTCKINHIRRQRQRQTLIICDFITGLLYLSVCIWMLLYYLGGVGSSNLIRLRQKPTYKESQFAKQTDYINSEPASVCAQANVVSVGRPSHTLKP